MPQQEVFLDRQIGDRHIQVVKTYDERYAREAFAYMDDGAQAHLWKSLDIETDYETTDVPSHKLDRADFLLEQMISAGREDWNSFSYFVVTAQSRPVYVSIDWPSAEEYAKDLAATEDRISGFPRPEVPSPSSRP